MTLAHTGASAPTLPLEDDLAAGSAAGYDAVELWLLTLWSDFDERPPRAAS